MKTQLLVLLILIGSSTFLSSQEITITKNGVKEEIFFDKSKACYKESVFMIVEQRPSYRGGMKKLESDLNQAISFNKGSKSDFQLRCTINCEGEIFGFRTNKNDKSKEVESIIVELLKLQNWEAGEQGGRQVDCFYTINGKIKRGKIKLQK